MAVGINDVEYVAKLARLEFSEEEKAKLAVELNDILRYVGKLSEVNTDEVEISLCSYPLNNVLRRDEEAGSLDKKGFLSNAPDEKNGYFRVPRVIEE